MNYPEGLQPWAYCQMEGCVGKGRCPRCGEINYHLMGYYGAVARWAKAWGISEKEAEKRMEANANARLDAEDSRGSEGDKP